MRAAVALAVCCVVGACGAPFGLGEPASRALEQGAVDSLSPISSFEVKGSYTEGSARWTIDLQMAPPGDLHAVFDAGTPDRLEAIVAGGQSYFRGQRFLADHLGPDAVSQNLAAAAGSSWWKSDVASAPRLPELFDGGAFRATFLGAAASRRIDHVTMDGVDSVELSGRRADVYVGEAAPHRLVRLVLKPGVVVDGVAGADFHYGSFGRNFGIAAPPPSQVIDFSNLSALPPVYTVVSVDTSGCGSPCAVSAELKNLGGATGGAAPSTITFTMTDAATGAVLARCTASVVPDVGYNETTTATCTMPDVSASSNAAIVTAAAANPGRGS